MAANALHITVVGAMATGQGIEVMELQIELPQGACVADALQYPGLQGLLPARDADQNVGIWGKRVPPHQPLADGDRLELYRPLTVDPMEARRTRFSRQGAGRAGLFTKKRAGAKAGY